MKVLVGVKRALDYAARVIVKPDKSGVDLAGAKLSLNPFCEIAVEDALRLREAGIATEVVAASIGGDDQQAGLRQAYALGVDRVVHVQEADIHEPLSIAHLLVALAKKEESSLLLLGKQSIDGDHNQTATFASKVAIDTSSHAARVERETDDGLEVLQLKLPAVITADLRLNTPRYPSLKNVLASKKKKIESVTAAELGVQVAQQLRQIAVEPPAPRPKGLQVGSVAELVAHLQERRVL